MNEPKNPREFTPQEKLAAALVAALAEIPEIGTDSKADSGKYKYQYPSLQMVLRHVKPHLKKHGLAVIQQFDGDRLQTTLIHEGGAMLTSPGAPCPADGVDAKGRPDFREWGKRATYARRHSLLAACGLQGDPDLDGDDLAPQGPPPTDAQPPADAPPEEVVIERIEKGFAKLNITKEEQADLWEQFQNRPDDLLIELLEMARREKTGREPGEEG